MLLLCLQIAIQLIIYKYPIIMYQMEKIKYSKFVIPNSQRLKDYLVKGYAINEKRLEQKQ